MAPHPDSLPFHSSVAVSSPGGFARQLRVQYQAKSTTDWRLYATFRRRDQAEQCLDRLNRDGYQARMVDYAICPAAA